METNISYRKKDKGWQYIISYKLNGKWKQKARQGFPTKKDANKAANKHLIELKANIKDENIFDTNYDLITFEQVADAYIEHNKIYKEYNTIKMATTAKIKFADLKNKKVIDIKKIHVQNCIDKLVKEGLSSSTITLYLLFTKLILQYYKDNFNFNYELPTVNLTVPKKTIKEKTALTQHELNTLLCKLKDLDDDIYIISLIAGTCGLRIGEIQGLTWADIIGNELNVNKQWKKLKDGSLGFGPLKNNKKRMVPIPEATLIQLKSYQKKHPTDITNRIIITHKFTLLNKLNSTLNKLAGITIHELRHTYATLLISSGIDFKTAAKILGHNIEQTLKTYSHVTDDMMNNAKNKIAEIF